MSHYSDYISINPYTGERLSDIPVWTPTQIIDALNNLDKGYQIWSQIRVSQRIELLQQIAASLQKSLDDLAGLITLEVGKPIKQSKAEIHKSISLINYYIHNLLHFDEGREIALEGKKLAYVRYFPKGIILGIMPWNFPVWQALRFAIPVIAGGNVVALKMAQNTGLTALCLEKVFHEASPDFCVYKSVFAGHDQVDLMLKHPAVAGLSLTGSERAGVSVGAIAGKNLKKCVLELGGSDSFIVLPDADIAMAAKVGARARLNNNGQTCIAAKRFILHKDIADDFTAAFIDAIQKYKIGSPESEESDLSVLARPDLSIMLDEQIKKSLTAGAKILLNGGRDKYIPAAYHPQVLTNIPVGSPAENEELFGPVASLFVAESEAQAIQLSNNTRYGLGASIWTNDQARAMKIAETLQVGSVAINSQLSSDPRVPFGGVKASGYGREMSMEGYYEFLNIKSIFGEK